MPHFDWNYINICALCLIIVSQAFGEGQNTISLSDWCHRGKCIAACVKINENNKTDCIRNGSSFELQKACPSVGCPVNASCEESDFTVFPDHLKLAVDGSNLSISWEDTTGIAVYSINNTPPEVTVHPFISIPFNTEIAAALPTISLMHFTQCGSDWEAGDICELMENYLKGSNVFKVTYKNKRLRIILKTDFNQLLRSFSVTPSMGQSWSSRRANSTTLIIDELVDSLPTNVNFWVTVQSNYCSSIHFDLFKKFNVTEVDFNLRRLEDHGYVQVKPSELVFNQLSADSVEIIVKHSDCLACSHRAECMYLYWGFHTEVDFSVKFINPRQQKLEPNQSSIELTDLDSKKYGFQLFYVLNETVFNQTIVIQERYSTLSCREFEPDLTKYMPYLTTPPFDTVVDDDGGASKGNSLLFILLGVIGGSCILACLCCLICLVYHGNNTIKNKVQRNVQSVQNVYDDHPSRNNSRKSSATSDHLTLSDFHKSVMLADHWEFEPMRLKLGASLGKGAFGQVVEGFLEGRVCVRQSTKSGWEWIPQDTGKKDVLKVAVKLLKDFATDSQKQEFLQEIHMMKKLGYHPNVVCLIGCCTVMEPVCLVVEACPQGDLKKYLLNSRSKILARIKEESLEIDDLLTSADLLSFARQITMGMEYLSQKGYVHRDLAARNVLVADNKSLKIADFGLTRYIYEERQYVGKKGARIPVKWMSIEAIIDGVYTSESDVWSFGVILYEIITLGGEPYPGIVNRDLPKMLCSGFRMEQPEQCPDDVYTMMLDTWHESPKQRPSFTKLRLQLEAMLEQSTPYLSLYPSQAHIFHCLDDIREESDEIDSASEAEPMLDQDDHKVDSRRDQSPSKLMCSQNVPLEHLPGLKEEEEEDDKDERDSVLEAEMEEEHPNQTMDDSAEYVNTGRQMSPDPSRKDEVILSLLSSPDSCDSGVAVDNRFLYDSKGRPIEYEGIEQMV